MSCTFNGCTNEEVSSGFCSTHRKQKQRKGEMWPINSHRLRGKCLIPNCDEKLRAKQFCRKHYGVYSYYVCPTDLDEDTKRCSVEACSLRYYAKNMCHMHYMSNYKLQFVNKLLK